MSENKYRAYFFANMYLPALHAGIQSQHTTAEMFVKYHNIVCENFKEVVGIQSTLYEWAKEDKTTIVLNGGISGDLQELVELFSNKDNPYPWAFFKETTYALNGALTNVGIVLPEKIYAYDKISKEYDESFTYEFGSQVVLPKLTEFEMKIVESLRGKRLMS